MSSISWAVTRSIAFEAILRDTSQMPIGWLVYKISHLLQFVRSFFFFLLCFFAVSCVPLALLLFDVISP